jgi:hypothetical protein
VPPRWALATGNRLAANSGRFGRIPDMAWRTLGRPLPVWADSHRRGVFLGVRTASWGGESGVPRIKGPGGPKAGTFFDGLAGDTCQREGGQTAAGVRSVSKRIQTDPLYENDDSVGICHRIEPEFLGGICGAMSEQPGS